MTDVAGWDYAVPSDVEPNFAAQKHVEGMFIEDDDFERWLESATATVEGRLGQYTATDIANSAANLVGGDRDRQHGAKADNFDRIAVMWNAWLDIRTDPSARLTGHDVGMMMSVMKLARTQSGAHNVDDYIDACGYAACAGEIASDGGHNNG
jgi:hypothetical protein